MIRLALLVLAVALAAPLAGGQETVRVHRLADTVSVRYPDGTERALYYFDPVREVEVGSQVEQGASAHTQVLLSGGGLAEVQSDAHFVIDDLGPTGDVIRFERVTLAKIRAGTRPIRVVYGNGAWSFLVDNSEIRVRRVPGRFEIRNQGNRPVAVTALDLAQLRETAGAGADGADGLEATTLGVGEEMRVPAIAADESLRGGVLEAWGRVLVRRSAMIESRIDGGALKLRQTPEFATRAIEIEDLQRSADLSAVASVGGVRTRVPAGAVLVVRNERSDLPPLPIEPVPAPAPAAPPTPEPTATDEAMSLRPVEPAPEPAPEPEADTDAPTDAGVPADDTADDTPDPQPAP